MVGAFSVHGSDEQILGANEQILGRDQGDQGAACGGPTDAQVIAGTIFGIASMFANGRH